MFLIEGLLVSPQPIDLFRTEHQLPASFGISQFATNIPYNLLWSSQSTLQKAGSVTTAAVPNPITADQLPFQVDNLIAIFRIQLVQQSVPYNISVEEIEQVTEHLRDFLLRPVYKLIELDYTYRAAENRTARIMAEFDMAAIYETTLQETTQLDYAGQPYDSPHGRWLVRPIQNIFGPAGLEIETAPDTYLYVSDPALALPAAPVLQALSIDLGQLLAQSFVS